MHKAQDQERLDNARATSDEIWKDRTRPTPEQVAKIKRTPPPPAPKKIDPPKPDVQQPFDQTADRRKPENKPVRNAMDTFFGDDKAALEKAQERKRNRLARKKRERSRPRGRGKGRTMD
jgi:hypothetical protein